MVPHQALADANVGRDGLAGSSMRLATSSEQGAYAAASIGTTRTSFLLTNSWMPMLDSSRP